ncbi:MAG: alanine racemase, partial [Actinobacteria bacterium]|nr:alanine racemase [Actinomycetota bacterium]
DDPQHPATQRQLVTFEQMLAEVRAVAPHLRYVHAANSAATLRGLTAAANAAAQGVAQHTMVRAGISAYGLLPGDGVADLAASLEPVMRLRTEVAHVQRVGAGEGVSYGLRTVLEHDTTVATLPLGYADGISRRAWSTDARVLVGGRRRRILGVVTMDQLMVDCGNDTVRVGDEAVIFGMQGSERITIEDWARALDTITYEVVCNVSSRVPRIYGDQ